MVIPPILDNKLTSMPSVFAPAALLREARRQKGLDTLEVAFTALALIIAGVQDPT
jgi:hypothetical protein